MTAPSTDPPALLAYLRRHPEGVTPAEVAKEVLRLQGPPEVAERIARGLLERTAGLEPGPDGRWRRPIVEDDRALALFARTTGPHPPADLLLEVGFAPIRGGRVAPARTIVIRPERLLGPHALEAAGVTRERVAGGVPLDELVTEIAGPLDGATLVLFRSDVPVRFLRRALVDRERPERPGPVVLLAPILSRAGRIPPRGTLGKAAAALRVPVPETEEAGDLARAIADVYVAARDRGIPLDPVEPRPRFDFGRVAFGPETIAALPSRPGIYRFLDRRGEVLYVGKAADLRARVSTYFGHRSRRRKLHAPMMERLWRLEWEETGSELEALIRELREIRHHRPPMNVQEEVRRRRRPAAGALVLFLPGTEEGTVDLLFVRSGYAVVRVTVERADPDPLPIQAAIETTTQAPPPAGGDDGEAQIIVSWLREKRDRQNYLDLSEAGDFRSALLLILEYLADPELLTRRSFRR